MFSRILVALDGSDGSRAALQQAVELAKALNAALHGMVVKGRLPEQATVLSEVKGEEDRLESQARRVEEQARLFAELKGVAIQIGARYGEPLEVIMQAVDEFRIELLIIGEQDQVLFRDWLKGNTTCTIARRAPCSVLLAKW